MYFALRKQAEHKKTIDVLKGAEALTETVNTTRASIRLALDSGFHDFEDAIHHFCPLKHKKINAIDSRNGAVFKNSFLPALALQEAVALLMAAR